MTKITIYGIYGNFFFERSLDIITKIQKNFNSIKIEAENFWESDYNEFVREKKISFQDFDKSIFCHKKSNPLLIILNGKKYIPSFEVLIKKLEEILGKI